MTSPYYTRIGSMAPGLQLLKQSSSDCDSIQRNEILQNHVEPSFHQDSNNWNDPFKQVLQYMYCMLRSFFRDACLGGLVYAT